MGQDEDKLLKEARTMLDRRADELDDLVLAKLRAARLRAVKKAGRRRSFSDWLRPAAGRGTVLAWPKPLGGLVAASLVLALALTVWSTNPRIPGSSLDDLEILAASESPEFYQDLDFYLWLEARRTRAG